MLQTTLCKVWTVTLVIGFLQCSLSFSDVSVHIGPTLIPHGNATGKADITIKNEKLAISIAVESEPPWGVARGGIVDIATVENGVISPDRASLMDFMPNNWSSWTSSYQKVEVGKNTPEEAVVNVERDWNDTVIYTSYSLKRGDNRVHVSTRMHNTGETSYEGLFSGYVLWPDGGYLFGVPGMYGIKDKGDRPIRADNANKHWMAAYDENWVLGLHAPYFDHINYGARDLYRQHNLEPGTEAFFESWLQVDPGGDLAAMVEGEIVLNQSPSGKIRGLVKTADGERVASAMVVLEFKGQPYAWTRAENGTYEMDLPVGKYSIYATAKGYASSHSEKIDIKKSSDLVVNLHGLLPPGEVVLDVKSSDGGKPLDAIINIEEGEKPLIEYLGKKRFFTQLNPVGQALIPLAPGTYRLKVAHGEGFVANPNYYDVEIVSGKRHEIAASIDLLATPGDRHWYSADMHHHSDVLDGFTSPAYVLRSQLGAGLDVSFLSDHNSAKNHQQMLSLASERNIPFIPSMEISPSWAHFNAYPLILEKELSIDAGTASVDDVFAAAVELGADVVQVNHPMIPYGYLQSLNTDSVPGGFNAHFDLFEVNALVDYDKTIAKVWKFWNNRYPYYFSAGSDTHNVWEERSGKARVYVQVPEKLGVNNFIKALKQGHSYVSFGPLVYPHQMFGESLKVKPGESVDLGFDVQAIAGLKSVKLIEAGEVKEQKVYEGTSKITEVTYKVAPKASSWYSLVVEDSQGNRAFTNPIWIDMINLKATMN